MNKYMIPVMLFGAVLTGCTDGGSYDNNTSEARTAGVSYVCVGMETSKRFGSCPGCQLDSSRMNSFLSEKYGYPGVLLQSSQATKSAVVGELKKAIARTPEDGLFIFYYSGHGGQEDLSSWKLSEPEGADSMDEYLCLYDTYLMDDDVWKIISSCKGRVFCIFDCCHSQTMFRSVNIDIAMEKGMAVPLEMGMVKSSGFHFKPVGMALSTEGFRMLCWSGCLEKEYSYGSNRGGVMTNHILSNWKKGQSYDELWYAVKSEVNYEQPGQHPAKTQYGGGFHEVFR